MSEILTYLIHSRNNRSNIVPTLGFEPGGYLTYCSIRDMKKKKMFFHSLLIVKSHEPGALRRFDVYTTSIALKRRRMDVKTTLCAYWEALNE